MLTVLKRDFLPDEIGADMWEWRAITAGIPVDIFVAIAESLDQRGVIGRFSTFLEHTKPVGGEERVSSFNGLFHWAVPAGREIEAGREIGRFAILTHCYWRTPARAEQRQHHGCRTRAEGCGWAGRHDAHIIETARLHVHECLLGGRAEINLPEILTRRVSRVGESRDWHDRSTSPFVVI